MISYFQVTLIRGLELFGVDLREFSQVMQKKAASSTSGKNIERRFSFCNYLSPSRRKSRL